MGDGGTFVPGMAEQVETRRKALHLSPGGLAEAAGLTRQALAPVRAGKRKQYHDVTINGVARALRWDTDWYDRLTNGQQPTEIDPPANDGRYEALERRVAELERKMEAMQNAVQPAPEGAG